MGCTVYKIKSVGDIIPFLEQKTVFDITALQVGLERNKKWFHFAGDARAQSTEFAIIRSLRKMAFENNFDIFEAANS